VLATRIRNAVSRHRFSEQAASAKERAETILEATPNAVFVSIDDRIVYANAAAFDLLAPCRKQTFLTVRYPPYSIRLIRKTPSSKQFKKDETNLEYERFQLDTPNGEVPVDGSARPITWDDSQAVVYVLQDISDRIGYEEQLERTHELLEHTERIADVGSWEVDTDSMDVFWSGSLFEILGIDDDKEPSLDEALTVYHQDDRLIVKNAVENALNVGEPFDVEVRFERPDGEVRWLRVQGTPTVRNDEVVALRGAAQDITDHKEIEVELRQERDLLEGIVETSPIGITVVDADGALTFVNERAEKIYGRPREGIGEFTHDDPRWDLVDENGEPLDSGDDAVRSSGRSQRTGT